MLSDSVCGSGDEWIKVSWPLSFFFFLSVIFKFFLAVSDGGISPFILLSLL